MRSRSSTPPTARSIEPRTSSKDGARRRKAGRRSITADNGGRDPSTDYELDQRQPESAGTRAQVRARQAAPFVRCCNGPGEIRGQTAGETMTTTSADAMTGQEATE